ncbi:MAG: cyclophilin-like family protein [Candidatus Nezhaarchaeales archaeon]
MTVVEKYSLAIIVNEVDVAEGELVRTYAPLTISKIVRMLPIRSRIYRLPDRVYFQVDLRLDVEKPREHVSRGDITFWPQASAIAFFVRDTKLTQPVSLIGKVTKGLEFIENASMGTPILIKLAT